jgi:glycosyltransferase involved in cell wall biosynthesis
MGDQYTTSSVTDHEQTSSLVTVVVVCYNQAAYLGEAIESVLGQSYPHIEIVVVDDGSTDHTRAVARAYPQVTYIYQDNQGVAVARNTGLARSRGDYLAYLDADDRLLPNAIAAGLAALRANPACAFTFGHYRYIWSDGSILHEFPQPQVTRDHYHALLRGNFIAMQGAVLFRRRIVELAGGFDCSLRTCEDYDLFLRLALMFPICQHQELVAEYRRHETNMTGRPTAMWWNMQQVLHNQRPYLPDEGPAVSAYREGIAAWRHYYARKGWQRVAQAWVQGRRRDARRTAYFWLSYTPLAPLLSRNGVNGDYASPRNGDTGT